MGKILIYQAGGGGLTSEDVTQVKAHVLEGETALTSDSDDEVVTGTMTVNSLLSFSVAAYSGRRVLAKWQNPKAAIGKPYSGVYIRYGTSGYPGKAGGTQIYKGAGNNTSSEGQSQVYLDLPNLNTTYYLSCIPYVTCSAGEMTGEARNATVKTSAQINLTIKGTQNYTIPTGYSKADIFAVGGGGGGGDSSYSSGYSGGGGGGGYTKTVKNIAVSSGQVLNVIVGAGGPHGDKGKTGNPSTVMRNNITLISAAGGNCVGFGSMDGGDGGSGGGQGAALRVEAVNGSAGASDGADGSKMFDGKGQGTTTRAFGESSGTLYAGGGGGGAAGRGGGSVGGPGGAGGGGAGGGTYETGLAGAANTGGGGGGGGYTRNSTSYAGGNGGSGIVLIRLY